MWSGLSSVASATVSAASSAVGGSAAQTHHEQDEQGQHHLQQGQVHLRGAHAEQHQRGAFAGAGGKRRSRPKLQHSHSSNRSSPEPSPERTRLKPFTPAHGHSAISNSTSRQRSPTPHSASATASHAKQSTPPVPQFNYETPGTERAAYFGSNESERDASNNDDYGDASSSEDSATELLDAVLGLDQSAHPEDGAAASSASSNQAHLVGNGGIRRELLVQRRVQEPSQHFGRAWDQWEQALMKPRRSPGPRVQDGVTSSPRRPRSLTPNVAVAGLASRRKASPGRGALAQDINAASSGSNHCPSPATPTSPAASTVKQSRIPFRTDLLLEVVILTGALILTAYRLASLPTPLNAELKPLTPIPLSPFVMLIIAIPCTALFRRKNWQSNYMFPFTDERGYRTPATVDDGFAAGATVPVLLAAGFLWDAVSRGEDGSSYMSSVRPLMDVWQAAGKTPPSTASVPDFGAVYRTVIVARISLLLSTSINSFVLILNIVLSRTFLSVEKVPKDNTKRLLGSLIVSGTISLFLWTLLALNDAFAWASPYISPAEAAISSFIYQMSLYTVSRLVRRGFTLGELSLATGSGISLALEFWRLTLTRLTYAKRGGIPPTFRMPTPLVPYQHVMIPGAFLTGFLLSPLLVLSRQFAQMPSHRLRKPAERGRNRLLAALGIALGLVFVVCVPFGGWAGWSLGGNLWTAWSWAARFSIFGGDGVQGMHGEFSGWKRWRRIALALYWLGIVTAAVGGWQTRIVRARRIRLAKNRNLVKTAENGSTPTKNSTLSVAGISELREDRRMHVALDLRRKFFHALAVVMFVPAIVIDPAFTSLAFSAAFAIFTFAEYARYFAVYPVGAPIHIFFNEFIDSKDAGPVILSHFYLLTGCAGGLWLEGKGIKNFTGVLSVGIGDAFASVLGRRLGTTKWPYSNKTITGTVAFVASVFGSAMLLRVTGLVEPFSIPRYLVATWAAGILEAVSAQNDNLVIPIFFWSLLSLLEV